jgi:1,4-dihydroxy-2-naphthoyl-CoA hydrolase
MSDVTDTPRTATADELEQVNASLGPVGEYVGLRVTEASSDRLVATWTVEPRHHQPYGLLHGGIHCTVVETLGSVAGAIWFGERGKVVGVSNSTDFYRAATEGEITSVAEPVHRGRTQQVWVVENRDAGGRLLARGQLRVQNLPHRAPD